MYTKVRMLLASLVVVIVLGIVIERAIRGRRRRVPERRSESELDQFIFDLKTYRDSDATQIVRPSRSPRAPGRKLPARSAV